VDQPQASRSTIVEPAQRGEVLVLGPVEVRVDGRPVSAGGARQRAVLAVLALAGGRVVSAEELGEAVWGDDAVNRSKGTLQVYVSNLRNVLGPAGREALRSRPPGYLLDPAIVTVDVVRFEELLAAARSRRVDDPTGAARLLREALALWRDDAPASDLAETLALDPRRWRLEELRAAAFEDRIDADLAAGRSTELVAELRELTARHPLRERLWEQLILALYRGGRQADALRAYQQARAVLLEEIGADPGPGLRRLEQQILVQSASLLPDDESAEARATLTWLDPEGRAKRVGLDPGRVVTLGRASDNTVVLGWDDRVSRRHAEVRAGAGGWEVRDCGSTNGTVHNDLPVGEAGPLRDGDWLRLGGTVVFFHDPSSADRRSDLPDPGARPAATRQAP
jgi:DNA-binding SARP family transcriptional activator